MFKNIVAAVDGSLLSLDALDMAAWLAAQDNAVLLILSAVEPLRVLASPFYARGGTSPSYMVDYREDQLKSYKGLHEEQIKRLGQVYPDLVVESKIVDGHAAMVIEDESVHADLIVMGHRGHGGVLDWMLGSVAKSVVDRSTVPVFIVKNKEHLDESSG